MQDRATPGSSSDSDIWVWIILAGLVVLAALIAFGSLAIMSHNQQMQNQTATPAASAPAAPR